MSRLRRSASLALACSMTTRLFSAACSCSLSTSLRRGLRSCSRADGGHVGQCPVRRGRWRGRRGRRPAEEVEGADDLVVQPHGQVGGGDGAAGPVAVQAGSLVASQLEQLEQPGCSSPRGSASSSPAAETSSRAALRPVSRCRKSATSKSATRGQSARRMSLTAAARPSAHPLR
jgi:hypothetical protein